jgi:uncharacterized phage-associated protein
MCLGVEVNKEKIGNLLIYLAEKLKPLYHTKLIKLLYLIDEGSVRDSGVPITWLDYKVWQYGPVSPVIYEIHYKNNCFTEYISCEQNEYGRLINPRKKFSDDEFSKYELDLIESIIEKYKNVKAEELVEETHGKNTLWSITKEENSIEFDSEVAKISPYSIDLSRLVRDDEVKMDNYLGAQDLMSLKV